MSFPLICLGNPLLDLQVDATKSFLEKYDLKDDDAILASEKHMPIYKEVLNMDGVKLVAGGAAQNTARGAQYLLPADSVVYFGSVGKDEYSAKLNEANAKYGLRTEYQFQENHATGKCAVLINGHNRSMATDLAAANHFTPEHLQIPANWKLVENGTHYYIGGYHLTVSPPAIKLLAEHASANNKTIAMNLSAPFIPEFFKGALDEIVPYIDYIIANESEAAAYASSHGLPESSTVAEIAQHIAKLEKVNAKRPRTVVFTQGLDPTITATYDATADKLDVKEYQVYPLESSKIVDTNGAGDAFAAGFMAALVEGKNLAQAVDVGQWMAALSIQEVGPTFPFPKKSYA
ncbi:hypothetical protein BABINDRAFT_171721 [Babjeviella inositovora NRRL Y-12698]|uniref:Adenosine kinase n=1 Tax=Babjeviella inositovora NRRL Y-12698 TaxID=984486 RepID=A0A1E3QPZ4_9ASCO|nr:uncharacterized protein BABINDRAFT_171721 [Babjeviella inositovora NRRL Y-12698]ODQ79534.1 hypothetical protein BABINDRAFT_171721 [Babjeviella inositovora NRRL Y-12698]